MRYFRLTLVLAALAGPAAAADWPATPGGRAAASAVLDRFETALDSRDSATVTLGQWCADHHLADPPKIVAVRDHEPGAPAPVEVRAALHAAPDEPVRYRRVALACGTHVLSEADNWYRPAALTAEMNRVLDETDTPFGLVVKPLDYRRMTLGVERLFDPAHQPARADGALAVPHAVLRHRAVLTAAGEPFSLVVETYTSEVLVSDPR